MARTVVVSTHLDDAVLSCWSVLDGPGDVVVLTVFTGGPPPGGLTDWDRDSGAADSAERMLQRVDEDRAALRIAGCEPVHVGLLEGQYGNGEVPVEALEPYLAAPVVFAPAGVGEQQVNEEHVRVRDVVLSVRPDARLYADQPYCRFRPRFELPVELADARVPQVVELTPAQRERKARAIPCYAGELPKLEAHFGPFATADRVAYELFWLPS